MGREKEGRLYDLGDKTGKLLAWLDKKERAIRLVPELHGSEGQVVTDPQEIVDQFATHYKSVYSAASRHAKS